MTFTVRVAANGWCVELFRGRTERVEHVFVDRGELLRFIETLLDDR